MTLVESYKKLNLLEYIKSNFNFSFIVFYSSLF